MLLFLSNPQHYPVSKNPNHSVVYLCDFQHVSSSTWEMGITVTYEAKPLLIIWCILGVRCVTPIFYLNPSWVGHFIIDTDISCQEVGPISIHAYGSLLSNNWSVLEKKLDLLISTIISLENILFCSTVNGLEPFFFSLLFLDSFSERLSFCFPYKDKKVW